MNKSLSLLDKQEVRRAIQAYHESNRLSLEIADYLRQQFHQLAKHYGPNANIFRLFFHDLMVHFSGIVIQRESLRDQEKATAPFPYVSAHYARQPFLIEEKLRLHHEPSGNSVRSLWRMIGLVPIALGEAVPFDPQTQWLSRKSLTLLTKYQPCTKAYLPNRNEQLDALSTTISVLAEKLEIPGGEILIRNWLSYANYHTSTKQKTVKERGLILGTRAELQNRKLAINFLQQDKPVVAMTHGEITNTIFNEPLFGYAESELCSVLIDYGDTRLRSPLNEPLVQPKKNLSRTSMPVQRIRKRDLRTKSIRKTSNSFLYIPTLYNGALHYGPFRGFEDSLYLKWQSELIAAIPDITIRPHPKSPPPPFETKQDHRSLNRCYADYDTLILDYYSTAATLMISTHKPVIYFDLGLRNLARAFQSLLEERCHYAKIDWENNIGDQIRRLLVEAKNSNPCSDTGYLAPFSITNQPQSRFPNLVEVLYEGLG